MNVTKSRSPKFTGFTLIELLIVLAIIAIIGGMFVSVISYTRSRPASSDQIQQQQQEKLLKEGTAQTGMPAIKNFRERKILKDILELRDQDGLVTYTYIFSQMTGKFTFIGQSIGYGIPYATQYTSPQKGECLGYGSRKPGYSWVTMPQADPNGLFSPATAEGTWILMTDPNTGKARPQYIEERIVVFTYKLASKMLNE